MVHGGNPVRTQRYLLIVFCLGLVFSVAATVGTMTNATHIRMLGILSLTFWAATYIVFRYLLADRLMVNDATAPHPAGGSKQDLRTKFSGRGNQFLVSGLIAILLGTVAPRHQIAFFIAGAVVCCYGAYFLYLGTRLQK